MPALSNFAKLVLLFHRNHSINLEVRGARGVFDLAGSIKMAATLITSWHPKFNGSNFDLSPSSDYRMTGLGGNGACAHYVMVSKFQAILACHPAKSTE